eukprot:g5374.t1
MVSKVSAACGEERNYSDNRTNNSTQGEYCKVQRKCELLSISRKGLVMDTTPLPSPRNRSLLPTQCIWTEDSNKEKETGKSGICFRAVFCFFVPWRFCVLKCGLCFCAMVYF